MTGNIKRTTPNYGFRIPYFDRTGWGREMERNFDVVDAALFASTGLGGIVGTWSNSTEYDAADRVVDPTDGTIWSCNVSHVSAGTGSFEDDRAAHPTYWTAVTTSFANRMLWTTATTYNVNDIMYYGYKWAIARRRFVSSASFETDLTNNDLVLLFDGTPTVDAAEDARDAALAAQTAAEFAQTQAANSATGAGAAASAASASATQALAFRNTAETHKNDAANSATSASGSATSASGSAATATTQAANALTSANNADISEANAAASATDSENYSIYAWQQYQNALAAVNSIGYLAQFRNKLINPEFLFWRRAVSQSAAGYLSADRWSFGFSGTTGVFSRQEHTSGQTDVPGNPRYYMRAVVTSVAGAGNYCVLTQPIEQVNTFQGMLVTATFWAKSSVAGKKLGIELEQAFGTGGSTPVQGINIAPVILSTVWTKYSITIAIPSIASKVIGTGDALRFSFWFDAGSTFNARSGNLGQQSGTFDISNVSLVAGDATNEPNPTSPREVQTEFLTSSRYWRLVVAHARFYASGGGQFLNVPVLWEAMRTIPTVGLISGGTGTNTSAITASSVSNVGMRFELISAGVGDCYQIDRIYGLDAEIY